MAVETNTERERPALIVGIGASAGGLDACRRLLAGAPADQGLAFVLVMHLDPTQESHIAEILAKAGSGTSSSGP